MKQGNQNTGRGRGLARGRSNTSLQRMLFVFYSIVLVCAVTVISVVVYAIFRNYYLDEYCRSRKDVLQQTGERVGIVKDNAVTLSNLYYYDYRIRGAEQTGSGDGQEALRQTLEEITDRYSFVFEGLNRDMYVVLTDGDFLYCSLEDGLYNEGFAHEFLSHLPAYATVMSKEGMIVWVDSYQDFLLTDRERPYVVSAARLMDQYYGRDNLGVLFVTVRESTFYSIYESLLDGKNAICIIDENGVIISHSNSSMIGKNYYAARGLSKSAFDGTEHYRLVGSGNQRSMVIKNDAGMGWTVVEEVPYHSIIGIVYQVRNLMVGVCALCIFICLLLSYIFSKRVSRPLQQFCQSMNLMREGNLDVLSEAGGFREIEELRDTFNGMTEEIRHLLRNIQEKEKLKSQAELQFLQAQIRPHFLNNTLFSIKCLIAMGKNDEAERMMEAFIALMEAILMDEGELIPIGEELQYLQQYILLIQYRYPEKFQIRYQVAGDILDRRIPKLLLQPIVENCIFHGIGPEKPSIHITVSGHLEGDTIYLHVHDDGVGMDQKTIAAILQAKPEPKPNRLNMVGIRNVHDRIQLQFGDAYGVDVHSIPGQYTDIVIRIPDIP